MGTIIAGYLEFTPDLAQRLIIDAKPLIDAALEEPGCLAYSWALDPLVPGRVHVFEDWESEDALAGHFTSKPYADMGAHFSEGPGILSMYVQKYRFDLAEPVYDPEGKARADFCTGCGGDKTGHRNADTVPSVAE